MSVHVKSKPDNLLLFASRFRSLTRLLAVVGCLLQVVVWPVVGCLVARSRDWLVLLACSARLTVGWLVRLLTCS